MGEDKNSSLLRGRLVLERTRNRGREEGVERNGISRSEADFNSPEKEDRELYGLPTSLNLSESER